MSGFNSSDAISAPTQVPAKDSRSQGDEPLAFTVHSLPNPEHGAEGNQRTRSGRWKMLAVLVICAAPVIASYFTYYVIRPTQQRSFGELVSKQPTLPDVQVQTLDGRTVSLASLKGQWLLVSTSTAECSEHCEKNLYLQRQLREALGKEKERLDWVWLVNDEKPVDPQLQPALAQAQALRVPSAVVSQWLQPASGHTLDEHLYVVDPLGHWMMRFPADLSKANAGKAKRDLERLLRASSSWDEAGR